jgi:hypothetical protein
VQLGKDEEAYRLLVFAVIVAFVAVWTAEIVSRRRSVAP